MSSFEDQIAYMNKVLEIQFSEDFIRKMKARVFIGYHRYGPSKQLDEENHKDIKGEPIG